MSDPNVDRNAGTRDGAGTLIAHAAAADGAAWRALDTSIDDFFLTDPGRLDEQMRVALARLLRALVATIDGAVRSHAVRLLRTQNHADLATALESAPATFDALVAAGALRDRALMAELIGRVRQELLASVMPAQASDDPERPSLVNRFAQHPDRILAKGAMAVLIAESRRRGVPDNGPLAQTDLPAELHHHLVWSVAAALRMPDAPAALDRALADSAQRCLAAHDEGDRLEAAVMRLATAIDAGPVDLAEHMVEALGDRRVALFAGLLAHALGIDFSAARDLTLDAPSDRLWLALRALDFPREAIARIGLALCEADPRRDVEAFADRLDAIMAVSDAQARDALAVLRLPADYRAAIQRLAVQR